MVFRSESCWISIGELGWEKLVKGSNRRYVDSIGSLAHYNAVISSTLLHSLSKAKTDEKEKRWEWANKRKQKGAQDRRRAACRRHVEWQRRREGGIQGATAMV